VKEEGFKRKPTQVPPKTSAGDANEGHYKRVHSAPLLGGSRKRKERPSGKNIRDDYRKQGTRMTKEFPGLGGLTGKKKKKKL